MVAVTNVLLVNWHSTNKISLSPFMCANITPNWTILSRFEKLHAYILLNESSQCSCCCFLWHTWPKRFVRSRSLFIFTRLYHHKLPLRLTMTFILVVIHADNGIYVYKIHRSILLSSLFTPKVSEKVRRKQKRLFIYKRFKVAAFFSYRNSLRDFKTFEKNKPNVAAQMYFNCHPCVNCTCA